MDKFLLIMCFSMVATAAANGGYNYQQARPIANQVFRPSPPFSNNPPSALPPPAVPPYATLQNGVGGPSAQYFQQQSAGPSQAYIPPNQYGPPSQYSGSFQQGPAYAPSGSVGSAPQYNQQQQRQTILTNTIYIHSAPEETEEYTPNQGAEADPIRKNYRILFIRAPTHNVRINAVKQTQAANEEKTIIYVLAKKPDITNIQSQVVQTEQRPQKPEVYFIKYKTQEEASRAQQEIQAQYDALGGSTSVSDEGFAPITSVIGGGQVNTGSSGTNFGGSSFSDQSSTSGSNFVQSASNSLQAGFQGNRGSAISSNFGVASPSLGYLPVKTIK